MTNSETKNWPDLSSFGAELKIWRGNAHRHSRLCLCLSAKNDGDNAYVEFMDTLGGRFGNVKEAVRKAGFDLDTSVKLNGLTEQSGNRFILYSHSDSTLAVSLEQLRMFFPDLQSTDVRPFKLDELTDMSVYFKDHTAEWQNFIKERNHGEFNQVWLTRNPEYIDSFFDSAEYGQYLKTLNHQPLQILETIGFGSIPLVRIFPSKEYALRQNIPEEGLETATLPFALPVAYSNFSYGSVFVLDDVRRFKDLTIAPPQSVVYPSSDNANLLTTVKYNASLKDEINRFVQEMAARSLEENVAQFSWLAKSLRNEADDLQGKVNFSLLDDTVYSDATGEPDFEAILYSRLGMYSAIMGGDYEMKIIELLAEVDRLRETDTSVLMESEKEELPDEMVLVENEAFGLTAAGRIEDTGEKIGGARKDFYRRSLCEDDLLTFNEAEKEELVNKANIWPPLDYRKMKDEGYEHSAVAAIKIIKDSLPTKPPLFSHNMDDWESIRKQYISAVGMIRQSLDGMKTLSDVLSMKNMISKRLTDNEYKELSWGKENRLLPWKTHCILHHKDYELEFLIRRLMRKFNTGDPWRAFIKEKTRNTSLVLSEKEKAKKDLRELDKILHIPHLEHVSRTSENSDFDWRNGREISAQDFIDSFGFRGVEFGNWLPQNERQQVLNLTYDSFCDLAHVLQIDKKNISLGGKLAIAFGSRGKGGKRAAIAHYEPARNVINLTRLKGAGSLAHEWFHALDRYCGGNKFASACKDFITPNTRLPLIVIDEAKKRYEHLEDLLQKKKERVLDKFLDMADAIAKYELKIPDTCNLLSDCLGEDPYQEKIRTGIKDVLEESLLVNAKGVAGYYPENPPSDFRPAVLAKDIYHDPNSETVLPIRTEELARKISDVVSDVYGKERIDRPFSRTVGIKTHACYGDLLDLAVFMEYTHRNLDKFPNPSEPGRISQSKFLSDAEYLDRLYGGKRYWSTEVELFARAGAAYIHDKLAESKIDNNYLVTGAEEERLFNKAGEIGKFSINPIGKERKRINRVFDFLFQEIKFDYTAQLGSEKSPSIY